MTQPQGHRGEAGFTLVEILVVMLVIGILAALVLPVFTRQRDKGYDADAKSNARSLATHVEACGTATGNEGDYSACDEAAMLAARTGLPIGSGTGEVEVTSTSTAGFELRARSASGRVFVLTRGHTGTTLACEAPSGSCSW